jgi:AraC family transcriptional regulator of adaptative response/methylated-DNA-[protein]-cysteine methyltransferase
MEPDYDIVERLIWHINKNRLDQPTLSELASIAGLSESHLQRVFQRWSGVSPKRLLQYLTANAARDMLRTNATVLDTAYEVGLSGPGRLHDLMVTVDAMTPGEIKAGGAGLSIHYGVHDSPFGPVFIANTERGICSINFNPEEGLSRLEADFPHAVRTEDQSATSLIARQVFGGLQPEGSLSVLVKGTNFQVKVWEALLRIPDGEATTYGTVANAIGRPTAVRAIGSAVGKNPIGYLIPCHRVLRADGALGGYRWGEPRKSAILTREAASL